jgi:hypothetical protein
VPRVGSGAFTFAVGDLHEYQSQLPAGAAARAAA